MTVRELIGLLAEFPPNMRVVIPPTFHQDYASAPSVAGGFVWRYDGEDGDGAGRHPVAGLLCDGAVLLERQR